MSEHKDTNEAWEVALERLASQLDAQRRAEAKYGVQSMVLSDVQADELAKAEEKARMEKIETCIAMANLGW